MSVCLWIWFVGNFETTLMSEAKQLVIDKIGYVSIGRFFIPINSSSDTNFADTNFADTNFAVRLFHFYCMCIILCVLFVYYVALPKCLDITIIIISKKHHCIHLYSWLLHHCGKTLFSRRPWWRERISCPWEWTRSVVLLQQVPRLVLADDVYRI